MINKTAIIIVDIRNMRCSVCKALVKDPLAMSCRFCNAKFDGVGSNHVGLAQKLEKIRNKNEQNDPEDNDPEDNDPENKYPELVGS